MIIILILNTTYINIHFLILLFIFSCIFKCEVKVFKLELDQN